MTGSAKDMVAWYRAHLGMGEPSGGNYVQRTFRKHNDIGNYNWAWCQATVAVASYETGSFDQVMFGKWDAYTVTCAERFKARGQWISGSLDGVKSARPGDVVYFDWGGSNDIGSIDHVGIVELNLGGGRLQTLEGNTSDQLLRRIRSYDMIAGLGRPKYLNVPSAPKPAPVVKDYWDIVPTMRKRKDGKYDGRVRVPWGTRSKGDKGQRVSNLQDALNVFFGKALLQPDGDFGSATFDVVKRFQNSGVTDENGNKLVADGVYGNHSARALYKSFGGKP